MENAVYTGFPTGPSVRTDHTGSGGITGGETMVTSYAYNDAGLPAAMISDVTGDVSTWSYDVSGRPVGRVDHGGDLDAAPVRTLVQAFNGDDSLASVRVHAGTSIGTVVGGDTYDYDAGGAITTQVVVGALATTDRYSYNPSGTLKSFAQGGGEDAVTLSYGWDHDGNRTSAGVSGSVSRWSYRADDSLAVGDPAVGASVSYHYSAAGELIRTDASGGEDVCSATSYDAFLRTREQSQSPTGACPDSVAKDTTRYSYDGLDRVQTTTTTPAAGDPVTSRSSYDGLGSTLVGQTHGLTGGAVSPGATPNVVYQLNVDGAVTGYAQDAAGSTPASITWLDTDGHGNTTGLLPDSVGASEVSCAVNYDPFGTPGAAPGSTAKLGAREVCATGSAHDTTANAIWYRGQARNATYGTYQLGARTYDPSLAAFTTPDTHRVDTPAQDLSVGTDPLTANTYTYVNGDPVNLADPNGHRAVDTSGNEVPWCVTHQCTPEATTQAHTDYHHIAAQTRATEVSSHRQVVALVRNFTRGEPVLEASRHAFQDVAFLCQFDDQCIESFRDSMTGAAATIRTGARIVADITGFSDIKHCVTKGTHCGGAVLTLATLPVGEIAAPIRGLRGVKAAEDAIKAEHAVTEATQTTRASHDIANATDDLSQASKAANTTARGWRVGDPIENLTKAGNSPAWSTVRARYWKNAANDALEGEYSASNLTRMQAGKPPLHDELGVPMELNHIIPRSQGGGHTLDNLEPLWPWEHAAVDPYRFYTGPTP